MPCTAESLLLLSRPQTYGGIHLHWTKSVAMTGPSMIAAVARLKELNLVLASASPRRLELLRSIGLSPAVMPSTFEENLPPAPAPEYALATAREKARDVSRRVDRTRPWTVVAADTVVCVDDMVVSKPASADDARAMLRRLSGRSNEVYTGLVVVCEDGRELCHVERTRVVFQPLSEEDIDMYVRSGEPMDKAGSYAIQGMGKLFIAGIEGDYFNVVGFPVNAFVRLCSQEI